MRTYVYIVALALLACSRSAQVADPGGTSNSTSDGAEDDAGDDGGTSGGDDDGSDSGSDEINFPKFRFIGTGHISCNGGTVGTATATLATDMDVNELRLVTERATFTCAPNVDECSQGEAAAKTQNSTGTNTYQRVSDEVMEKFEKDDDVPFGRYAEYTTSVLAAPTAGSPTTTTFDKPLPVFPAPGPKTRFEAMDDGITWTAHASGSQSLDVTLTMKKIVGNDNVVAVEMNVDIPPNAYATFPIPKRAIYRMDPKSRRVTQIEITKIFKGDSKCEEGEAYMDFKICQATEGGVTEDIIPCQ